MAKNSQGSGRPGKNIEANPLSKLPSPVAPIPSPETDEELQEQFDEEPSLLDEPEILPACLKDLAKALKDGMGNYPSSAKMAKTAPDNFRYLYAQEWELLPNDKNRRWHAVEAVEKLIKERE